MYASRNRIYRPPFCMRMDPMNNCQICMQETRSNSQYRFRKKMLEIEALNDKNRVYYTCIGD